MTNRRMKSVQYEDEDEDFHGTTPPENNLSTSMGLK